MLDEQLHNRLLMVNIALKVVIIIIAIIIGMIAFRGFERVHRELFGIRVVMVDFSSYMQGK